MFEDAEDDFNPRSNTAETSAEFGDFYSALSTEATAAKTDDDFADFHSAFSDQTSSLPATMPAAVAPASGNCFPFVKIFVTKICNYSQGLRQTQIYFLD